MKALLTAGALAAAALPALAADTAFSTQRLSRHIQILASDAYEGRGPATPSEARTVRYIIDQFKAAGLQPGGDMRRNGAREWTQAVPLSRFEITGPVAAEARTPGGAIPLRQGEEASFRAAATGQPLVDLKDAPVVFIGYGVSAPERNWDDFKGMDLKGKVALVLVNDPDFETGSGDFGGKAMTYYGRWTYKYEEAARRGAAGILVIHETAPAAYGWATVKNSNTNAIFDIIRAEPAKAHAAVEGWIQRDAAISLFKAAGLNFGALKTAAAARNFRPVTLTGVNLSIRYPVKAEKIVTRNVAGLLPGKTRPKETVIYTAHWDHLGVGEPDAKGDRIYNGAVDNASGVAQLIEMARAHARAPRAARSVVFLSVGAEEKGLLGSEYYVANPLYPLAATVGVLNTDGGAVLGRARDFSTSGDGPTTLQDMLVEQGAGQGRTYTPDPQPEAGLFFRSDHFPFAKAGVPAISFKAGQDLLKGGKAAGKAGQEDYTANRYHQPGDEWRADWDLAGMVQDDALLYALGRSLATSRVWPEWKPGSEFKAARDASAATRR